MTTIVKAELTKESYDEVIKDGFVGLFIGKVSEYFDTRDDTRPSVEIVEGMNDQFLVDMTREILAEIRTGKDIDSKPRSGITPDKYRFTDNE